MTAVRLRRAGGGHRQDPGAAELANAVHEQVAGLDRGRLLVATEDALRSALVRERSARSLSFSHALVRTAVHEATSTHRRAELQRRAAVVLGTAAPDTILAHASTAGSR
jgi:hypothetical protein